MLLVKMFSHDSTHHRHIIISLRALTGAMKFALIFLNIDLFPPRPILQIDSERCP